MRNETTPLYGLIAEFDDEESLLEATRKTREAGYDKVQAYTPYYVEGLGKLLNVKTNFMPWLVFGGLIVGALAGFFLQYWTDVIQYPLNIGGRPFNSWQAFTIITFEAAILTAGLAATAGFFLTTNLPLPYHPAFNAEGIDLASSSNFFLLIAQGDARYDEVGTRQFLEGLEPERVSEVTW